MAISYDLKGKTALITGAASGIGLATAWMIAKAGGTAAINFLPEDPRGLEAVARLKSEGLKAIAAPGHVGHAGEAEKMIANAVEALGRLDLLVNNAGTPGVRAAVPMERLDLINEDLWAQILETNLLGVFRCSKAAEKALRASKGAIVNTASIAAYGGGSTIAYSASKAGVVNLTHNLARALAPDVRVNAVAPGAVASAWQVEWTPEQKLRSAEGALLKRWGTPEDIAEVIMFLGFGAGFVTGQTLVVDGGLTN